MGARISLYAYDVARLEQLVDAPAPGGPARARLAGATTLAIAGYLDEVVTRERPTALFPLVVGQRRWWIGSLLDGIDRAWALSPPEQERLAAALGSLLGGHPCGFPIPAVKARPAPFPLVPGDDAGLAMGAWSPEDARFVAEALDRARRHDALRFGKPPGPLGPSSMTAPQWDAWVRDAIDGVCRLLTPPFPSPAVVAFIG